MATNLHRITRDHQGLFDNLQSLLVMCAQGMAKLLAAKMMSRDLLYLEEGLCLVQMHPVLASSF